MRSTRWVAVAAVFAAMITTAATAEAVPGEVIRSLAVQDAEGEAARQGTFESGRADGARDGSMAAIGSWGLIGAGAACCFNLPGCLGAAFIAKSQSVGVPPRGVDPRYTPAYQQGYRQGYEQTIQDRRFKAALIGGGIATVVGTLISVVAYVVFVVGAVAASESSDPGAPTALRGLLGAGRISSWQTPIGSVGATPSGFGVSF